MGKIFISLILAAALIAALMIYGATSTTSALVYSPSQLVEMSHNHSLPRVKVGGKVAEQGIEFSSQPRLELKFRLSDPEVPDRIIPVQYYGMKPDMFSPGRDVLVEGSFENGTIMATNLLTQCPSKYEPPTGEHLKK